MEALIAFASKPFNLSLKFKIFCTLESSFHGEQTGEEAIITQKIFFKKKYSNSKRARKSQMTGDV